MSVRNYPGGASNGKAAAGSGLSGATTGDKLSYICPAGVQAAVRFASVLPTAGAATITFRAIRAGTTVVMQQSTTAMQFVGTVFLNPTDSFRVNVSVLDLASVFDATIEAQEFPST